ncbi:restriction endonuclease subunit S [Selenomonas bovis]|uniref:restriction endonuclease subunit S n=1 Tax=Selenomonas bovis TaxID=416586 RepID=UPI0003687D3B|nr:restriction endonuclease subunit S [Selenomonas bovis]
MKEKKVPAIRFQGFTDDWEQRKVGNLYDFKNGLNKGKEFFGTGVPIVNFTDVFHHRGLIASQLYGRVSLTPEEVHNFLVKKGDIFFTRTSETIEEIGYPSVMLDTPKDTVFSGFVLRGRSIEDSDSLDDLFKKYVFFTKSFRSEMTKKSSMTTRALTSGTSIKKMLFHYPESKKEQHQIGFCITELDNLIALHQRKLTKLQLLKKSMLTKMFPKDGARVPEIRFQGFHGNWEHRKISEMFKITRGYVLPTKYTIDIQDDINKYPVFSSQTANNGLMGYYKDYLYENAITWTTDGANAGTVRYRRGKFYCTNVCGVLLSDNITASKMIAEALNQVAKKYVSYVGNPKLMNNVMADIVISLPQDKEEQDVISKYFEMVDYLILLQQRKLSKLHQIKQAMLSKLFV